MNETEENKNWNETGIEYIRQEGFYLFITGIFPFFIAIVQILNILFIIGSPNLPVPLPDRPPHPPLLDVLLPPIVLSIFSLVGITKFIFLIKWRRNLSKMENDLPILTKLFYDIIQYVEKVKWLFIVENILFIFYSNWIFQYFINDFLLNRPPPGPPFIQILNLICQIGLIIYLIFEWRYFLRWNRKLNHIRKFEERLAIEIDL